METLQPAELLPVAAWASPIPVGWANSQILLSNPCLNGVCQGLFNRERVEEVADVGCGRSADVGCGELLLQRCEAVGDAWWMEEELALTREAFSS